MDAYLTFLLATLGGAGLLVLALTVLERLAGNQTFPCAVGWHRWTYGVTNRAHHRICRRCAQHEEQNLVTGEWR